MPNSDIPPTENVRPTLLHSLRPFVQKVVKSKPKRHEIEYMKEIYDYEVAHQAYDNPLWRRRFLLLHFSEVRWQAGKEIGAHITVAIITILFFF